MNLTHASQPRSRLYPARGKRRGGSKSILEMGLYPILSNALSGARLTDNLECIDIRCDVPGRSEKEMPPRRCGRRAACR